MTFQVQEHGNTDGSRYFETYADAEAYARCWVKDNDNGRTAKSCGIYEGRRFVAVVQADALGRVWTSNMEIWRLR